MLRAKATTTGGRKVNSAIRQGKKAQGVSEVRVGFFSTAKYPDGTPVTNVAAWNEFGTRSPSGQVITPERPFFRNSNRDVEPEISSILARVNPKSMVVSDQIANLVGRAAADSLKVSITTLKDPPNLVGRAAADSLKVSITTLKDPPNSPVTIDRKGSSNPLIDTAKMRNSADYEIVR